ncbi:hypothetical protein KJ693_11355 [bacterium]|nr:hypothetical protein [bacterium]MBU1615886.1 hypothetical protein [bacterium]
MKKDIVNRATNWEMRKEYDFSNVRPNKYAEEYAKGTNIVVIEPDLVEFFPNSESVNTALRALASIFPKYRLEEKPKKSSLINHATMA